MAREIYEKSAAVIRTTDTHSLQIAKKIGHIWLQVLCVTIRRPKHKMTVT